MITARIGQMLNDTVEQFVDEGQAFSGYDITVTTREREGIKLFHRDVRDDIHQLQAIADCIAPGEGYERTLTTMYSCGSCGHKFVVNPDEVGDRVRCGECTSLQVTPSGPLLVYHPHGYDLGQYRLRTGATANGPGPSQPVGRSPQQLMSRMARPTANQSFVESVEQNLPPKSEAMEKARQAGLLADVKPVFQQITEAPTIDRVLDKLKQAATPPTVGSYTSGLDYRQRLDVPEQFLKAVGINPAADCFIVPDAEGNCVYIRQSTTGVPQDTVVCTQKSEHSGGIKLPQRILKMAGLEDGKFRVEIDNSTGTSVVKITKNG